MARRRRTIQPVKRNAFLVERAKAELPELTVARADVEGAAGAVDLREHMEHKADPAVQLHEQVGRTLSPAEAELARRYHEKTGLIPNRKARRKAIARRKRYERSAFKGIR
jgi:hypothetical protein